MDSTFCFYVGVVVFAAPKIGVDGFCFFEMLCFSLSDAVWQRTFLAQPNIDAMLKKTAVWCGIRLSLPQFTR